jgi:hypothetical protein
MPNDLNPCAHATDRAQLNLLERTARRRAAAKLGWYTHATVFVAINLLLVALSAASGKAWAVFPALGWGLGLAIHGVVVFLRTANWYERMVRAERARLG